ncbi:unnamed protein product [Prorocentrum cordatum]|nr:unnamed protein product [Polarella glacialis]
MPFAACSRRRRGGEDAIPQEESAVHEVAREADVETQGLNPTAVDEHYGALPQKLRKAGSGELPLLLGRLDVAPGALLRALLLVYVLLFFVNIVADAAYFATVDARFPPGLGYLYPSEWERQQSVVYTRHVLAVGMLQRSAVFGAVLLCVYFKAFARVDAGMRWLTEFVAAQWEQGPCQRFCGGSIGGTLSWCYEKLCGFLYCSCAPCRWIAAGLERCCCCSPVKSCLAGHSACELLHGSVYLGLFAACFFLIGAPFTYWRAMIDLNFGFANALTVTPAAIRASLVGQFVHLLLWGIPGRVVYLAVLRFRFGWLLMWGGMIAAMIITHYNFSAIVPKIMGMNNAFPTDNFVVGRGFPLVGTSNKAHPWVSLNRIFFNVSRSPVAILATHDLSQGQLVLAADSNGSWVIAGRPAGPLASAVPVYARSQARAPQNASAEELLSDLGRQRWSAGEAAPERVGARSGRSLRDKVMGFARERNISIHEIYMVDGSHKDARANAFVGGIDGSIIGLYDTLFLGQHENDGAEDAVPATLTLLGDGGAGMLMLNELVQEVDAPEEEGESVWSSTPTQAMTDDEIIAILAHELAHPDLGHLHQGMVMQAASSLVTYASLGWAAHSPLFAAALSLGEPMVHVGACAYGHIVGPPVDGVVKFVSDWLIR